MPSHAIMRRLVRTALMAMLLVVVLLGINAHARPVTYTPLRYSVNEPLVHKGGVGGGSTTTSNNNGGSSSTTTTTTSSDTPSRAELQRLYRSLGASNPGVYNEANQQLYGNNNNSNEYSTTTTEYTTVQSTTTVVTKTITKTITQTVYVYITYTPHVVGYYLSSIEELMPPIPPWQFMMPSTVEVKSLVKEPMGYLVTAGLGVDFFIGNATKTVIEKYNPVVTYTRSVSTGSGPTSTSVSQSQSTQAYTNTMKVPTTIVNNTYININGFHSYVNITNNTYIINPFTPFYYNTTIPEELAAQGYREFEQGVSTGDLYETYQGATQWVYNELKYYYETGWNDLQNWWYNYVANGQFQQWLAHALSAPAGWLSSAVGALLGNSASTNVPSLQGQAPGPYPPPVSAYGNDWVGIGFDGQPVTPSTPTSPVTGLPLGWAPQ